MSVELPEPLDVIAVGAHPDDVEIAIGGTLASLVRQGYRVGIIDLTDGEPTPGSPGPEVRLAEAKQAAEILGVQVRETLALPNRRLFDCFEARVELGKVFSSIPSEDCSGDRWKDSDGVAGSLAGGSDNRCGVFFYSRLTKWDADFDGLPVHTVSKQLWYPLGFRTLEPPSGSGHFVVDISETFDVKLDAVRAYKTQFPPHKQQVFRLVEGQNRLFGTSAGFEAGEMLICSTTLGVTDLVKTVLP